MENGTPELVPPSPLDADEPQDAPTGTFFDDAPGFPSDGTAAARAGKFRVAWPEGPPAQEIEYNLKQGNEVALRQRMASDKEAAARQNRLKMVYDLASFGEVTPEQQDYLLNLQAKDIENPNTVLEKWYGQHYVNTHILNTGPNSVHEWGRDMIPAETDVERDKASHVISNREIAGKVYNDLNDAYEKQSTYKKGLQTARDTVLGFIPGFSILENGFKFGQLDSDPSVLRDIFQSSSALQQRIMSLYRLPPDQFHEALMDEIKDMDPSQALAVTKSVMDFGGDHANLRNWFPLIDLAVLGAMSKFHPKTEPFKPKWSAPEVTELEHSNVPVPPGLRTREAMRKAKTEALAGTRVAPGRNMTQEELANARRAFGGVGTDLEGHEMTPQELQRLQGTIGGQLGIEYKTAQGSHYIVHPDGSTSRNASNTRPQGSNSDRGPQPKSDRTVYLTEEAARALAPVQGSFKMVDHGNGQWSMTTARNGVWGISPSARGIRVSETPGEGLIPMEVWGKSRTNGADTYRKVHFGNKITEIIHPDYRPISGDRFFPHVKEPDVFASGLGPEERVRKLAEQRNRLITLGETQKAMADLVESTAVAHDPPKAYGVAGNVERGSQEFAKDQLIQIGSPDPHKRVDQILNNTVSLANPQAIFLPEGSGFSREAGQRLVKAAIDRKSKLTETLDSIHQSQVSRIPEEAEQAGIREAQKLAMRQYGDRFVDAILDVVPLDRDISNTRSVELQVGRRGNKSAYGKALAANQMGKDAPREYVLLSRPNATLFDSRGEAMQWAQERYQLAPDTYAIKQRGEGWYIAIEKPVAENNAATRGAIVTNENQTPISLANTLFGNFRSADDILPKFISQQRHLATHAVGELRRVLLDAFKDISVLPKRQKAQLKELLDHQGDMENPDIDGMFGYYSKSQADLERDFFAKHGSQITEEQSNAYWTYVQLSDFDYLLRNLNAVSVKNRQGVQKFTIRYNDGKGNKTNKTFEGVEIKDLYADNPEEFNWANIDSKTGDIAVTNSHDQSASQRGVVTRQINQNKRKIIQVYDPKKKEFAADFGHDAPVHFIVTDTADIAPIDWQQIKYNPGPHQIYPNGHFVKQMNITRAPGGMLHYTGDMTFHDRPTERQARRDAEAYDTARKLHLAGRIDELRDFLPNHIPYSFDQWMDMVQRKVISLEDPFVYTKAGTRTIDTVHEGKTMEQWYGGNLRNHVQSKYNLSSALDNTFTADRDSIITGIAEDRGTEGRPIYRLDKSKTLDSFTALERSLGQSTRQTWMGDLKSAAMEQWIQEWGGRGVLNISNEALMRNPAYFFHHPEFNSNVDASLLRAAKASRQSSMNFIGQRTDVDRVTDWVENFAANMIYDKFGDGKTLAVAQKYLLPAIHDPWLYARTLAFHTKLGVFNPKQLLLQAQSLGHVMAVAGVKNGVPGLEAAWSIRRAIAGGWPDGERRAILEHFANRTHGWEPGEFKEMYDALRSSGYGNVMGETAWKDDISAPNFIKTKWGNFLDAGTWFFAEGERITRLAAFASAFKEMKANGMGAIGNRELSKLVTRADTFNINMTRASNANMQQGVMSVPLQFLSFNWRLAEQLLPGMLGKGRLTQAEAFKAFTMYSMMYGVPIAAGGATGVIPFYDMIKGAMIDRGINTDNNPWLESLVDGIPAMVIHATTGKDYAIGSNLGVDANNLVSDMLAGKKSILDVALGASGGVLKDFAKTLPPFVQAAVSFVKDQGESFPLMTDDFVEFASTVTSFSNAMKMYYAMSVGKSFTKDGKYVTDVTPVDGLVQLIAGVKPMDMHNATIMKTILSAKKDAQAEAKKRYQEEIRKAMSNGADNNVAEMQSHLKRAKTWARAGDANPAQEADWFKELTHNRELLGDMAKTKADFWSWRHNGQSQIKNHLDYVFPNRGQ